MQKVKGLLYRNVLFIALRNLTTRRLRTLLTVGGVVIGVGSIVVLMSFGIGLQRLVSREVVGSSSLNTIDVTAKSSTKQISPDEIAKMKANPGVKEVIEVYTGGGSISVDKGKVDAVFYGTQSAYLDISGIKIISGEAKLVGTDDAIVNTSVAKAAGLNNKSVIGKTIDAKISQTLTEAGQKNLPYSRPVRVVGVVETGSGAEAYVKADFFKNADIQALSQVKVISSNRDKVRGLMTYIEGLDLSASSPIDSLAQIENFFRVFNIVLLVLGAIGIVVGVLGMFNTLTISLVERTKEIGLLLILGAKRRDIRRLFVSEALILSVIGGATGLGLAWAFGFGINSALTSMAHSRGVTGYISLFYIPSWLVGLTMAASFFLGLIVVAFPARRAVRVDPINAIRRDG